MADVSMNIGASPVSLEISDALGPIEMDINPIGLSNSTIGLTLPGPKGEKGDQGTGITIHGSYPSYEALIAARPTGEPAEAYLVEGHLYVWSETDFDWIDVGDIQGPKGDPGKDGADGYTPVKGTDYWTEADKSEIVDDVMAEAEGEFQPLTDSLTEETDLADGDAFPFHDASVDAPRKSLWSNIKSKLKSYFDTLYAALAHSHALDGETVTGVLPLSKGGLGVSAADAAAARAALGIPRMCSGTATVSLSADSLTTLDITFPAGIFSATPDVVATIKYSMNYSATNLILIAIDPDETSATKVRFRFMRRGGAITVDFCWVAMQMPS